MILEGWGALLERSVQVRGISRLVASAVLLAAATASEAEPRAAWRVYFRTGGSIDVASVVPDDELDPTARWTRLVLADGGTVRVPSDHLGRLEELEPESVPIELPEGVRRWDELVDAAAARHGLEADLVRAIIAVESAGDPRAVSPKGAVGLMQLMPATAAEYGCRDRTDPRANIEAGCRHLARLHEVLAGDLTLVLAAYNAGEGAVKRFGGVPAFTETRRYVRAVRALLEGAAS